MSLVLTTNCSGSGNDPDVPPNLRPMTAAGEPVDARCTLPTDPTSIYEEDGAVLLVWEFEDDPVYQDAVLPDDGAFLRYREAIRADGGDLVRPIADPPDPKTPAEVEMWRDESFNHDLAQGGQVGSIQPITCLDALLFAHQNARVDQLDQPTEFLASVLRRKRGPRTDLVVVFGAGTETFSPKSVYGFDVVDEYLGRGWSYWYALHNHTIQRNGPRLALGNPTLSTSDVQLSRALVSDRALESARVTNGFHTFSVPGGELNRLRSR
jgi:hypothetical protein